MEVFLSALRLALKHNVPWNFPYYSGRGGFKRGLKRMLLQPTSKKIPLVKWDSTRGMAIRFTFLLRLSGCNAGCCSGRYGHGHIEHSGYCCNDSN